MQENIQYSVVIPVYNGSSSLEELFLRLKKTFEEKQLSFEAVFIDDDSRDSSWTTIRNLKLKHPGLITGIKLSKNFGQQNATMCGFFHAKGNFIVTMDDDLEMQPEDIPKLIERHKETGASLIYGTNRQIGKISIRSFFTKTYKELSRLEGPNKGKGSSFRLMTKNLVDGVKQNAGNFVFIDEVCLWYTDNIAFAEVSAVAARRKKSRYTFKRLFRLAGEQIIVSSTYPLKIMIYFGVFVAIVNFLLGLRFIYRKIILDVPLGYTSIVISILFSTGIILICIGVIGEYIGRIIKATNKVPSFNIDQKI